MTSQPQIPSSQGYIPKNWTVILSNETQKLQIHPTLMASEEVFLSDSGIFLEFGSCRPSITDYSINKSSKVDTSCYQLPAE
ncbi:unnamed protein product [Rhizophagus irregularis]|nr:unnamed protein product [Rhizophagus irregularis]